VTAERTIVTPDGVKLATREDGDAPAPVLLCCNSLGAGLDLWERQTQGWSSSRRVLRFDQRGHGRSEAPPGGYRLDQLGADAVAVLDGYDVTRADLCGVSLGGLVALWVALHRPERVRRVVLACTAARLGTRESWEERADLVREGGTEAIADLVMRRFFSDAFRAAEPATVAHYRAALVAMPDEGYIGTCLALAEADLRDRTHQARAPALVIAGSADQATPPDQVRALRDAIPGAAWLELKGAGHLPNVEQPERFEAAVHRFLTDA
jgi:3-oxoadipate enol-lactonase